ncbi:ATP-dependent DNA helicase [Thermocladium modestius]|uniref:ATP-dependent DNA helicase n=1 Tax=Thermocladium modestius TaxID=62609 RepID=UPI0016683B47|nr:ATP-dependent DNA helicase [Thermocladium modestius]
MSKIMQYFPYDSARKPQEKLIESILYALDEGLNVVVEAPTGVGKTAAALASALSYAMDRDLDVIYLIRTKNQAQAPMRELSKLLERKGIAIPYVLLRNRADMCCLTSSKKLAYKDFLMECNYLKSQHECRYYEGTMKGVPESLIQGVKLSSPSSYVRRFCAAGLCPYDSSRMLSNKARLVILSYYYLFAMNRPETVDLNLESSILIVDEVHNLPSSIIDLNTVQLTEYTIRASINEVKQYLTDEEARIKAMSSLKTLLTMFRKLREKIMEDEESFKEKRIDASDVLPYFDGIDTLKAIHADIMQGKRTKGLQFFSSPLTEVLEFYSFIITKLQGRGLFYKPSKEGDAVLSKLLDPSIVSGEVFKKVNKYILMSGSLPPVDYIKLMLGLRDDYRLVRVPLNEYISMDNIRAVIYPAVTTKYDMRDESMYSKIAEAIESLFNSTKAGLLAVFPSYDVMKRVRKYIHSRNVITELSSTSIDGVMDKLADDPHQLILGVAGGKLIEGIEFKVGDRNAVDTIAIVGVPYPEPSDFLQMILNGLSAKIGNRQLAWHIVYTWNALIKVKQSIGRGIRSERDRVYVVLMDDRFAQNKALFDELKSYLSDVAVIDELGKLIDDAKSFNKH